MKKLWGKTLFEFKKQTHLQSVQGLSWFLLWKRKLFFSSYMSSNTARYKGTYFFQRTPLKSCLSPSSIFSMLVITEIYKAQIRPLAPLVYANKFKILGAAGKKRRKEDVN